MLRDEETYGGPLGLMGEGLREGGSSRQEAAKAEEGIDVRC